ncbi:acetyltransferase (GNAT) family protein [Dietzia cinnamea]|uniref:Acetyltransferase (GNAT) family protein n=1 Tax=Dietzia cinnamea TaxID=321318 RepID=A0A4R3ZXQ4_9ACTN|nr:acetyltransferase (GNAT) family protein [Dietzia cinnamea]
MSLHHSVVSPCDGRRIRSGYRRPSEFSPSSPRLADVADVGPAADTLASAFADYPWTRYVIPAEGYQDRLRALQELYLHHAVRHGLVAVHDDPAQGGAVDGVIAVLPPRTPDPAPETVARIVALHGDRIDRLTSGGDPEADWRLETLGVLPSARGRGLGSALTRFAIVEAVRRGARSMALETSDPLNVRLYERLGFTVTARSEAPEAPPMWRMRADLA